MSADRIKEIRERVEKATAGPWKRFRYDVNTVTLRMSDYGHRRAVIYCGDIHHEDANDSDNRQQLVDDTDFIAHARQDIPWLLTELATAQAELARLKADAMKVTTEATIEHVKNKAR